MTRLAALIALAASPVAASPRIVSINPCIDAVLVRVANAAQIAAISHYSKDPSATSIPLAVAAHFKATSGTAEEVVALQPDIVIAGEHVALSTQAALARLGVRLVRYKVPATIAESAAQVRSIAALVGHAGRGDALAATIDKAAVRDLRPPIPALIWQGGGLVPGAGTLADDLLRTAGFRNVSASYGLQQWDVLPLEYLVAKPPAVLFARNDASGRDRMLSHPILRRLASRVVDFPQRLLFCGGPAIPEALARLRAAR